MSLTLAEYADAVGVTVSFLESLGLRDEQSRGETRLVIPYYNPDGTLFRERLRLCLKPRDGSKDKKFLWGKLLKPDDKTCLYGLQRLKDAVAAKYVVIVEGESDAHVLWSLGFPALAVPGNKGWNDDRDAPFLDGILTIFVVIEPGQSGQGVLKWLGEFRHTQAGSAGVVQRAEGPARALPCGQQRPRRLPPMFRRHVAERRPAAGRPG